MGQLSWVAQVACVALAFAVGLTTVCGCARGTGAGRWGRGGMEERMLEALSARRAGDVRRARTALHRARDEVGYDTRVRLALDVVHREPELLARAVSLTDLQALHAQLELDAIAREWRTAVALSLSSMVGVILSLLTSAVVLVSQLAGVPYWVSLGAVGVATLGALFTGIGLRVDYGNRRGRWVETHLRLTAVSLSLDASGVGAAATIEF